MSEDQLRAELECAKQEVAELRAELAAAKAERGKLAAFAREIISFECWGYQQIDGGDIQEIAENMGLIEASIATEADAATMNDVCAGDRIYRFAPWLRKMMDGCVTLTQEQDNG